MNKILNWCALGTLALAAINAQACFKVEADKTISNGEIDQVLAQIAFMSPIAGNKQLEACAKSNSWYLNPDQVVALTQGLRETFDGVCYESTATCDRDRERTTDRLVDNYLRYPPKYIDVNGALKTVSQMHNPTWANSAIEEFIVDRVKTLTWDQVKVGLDSLRDVEGTGDSLDLEPTRDRIVKAWIERDQH